MSTPQILDPDALEALRSINPNDNGEFLRELVDIFLTDTPRRIEELRVAIAAKDLPTMSRAAHSMKGSAGNFGAAQFAAINAEVEARIRAGQTDGLATMVPTIELEFKRVETALLEALSK